MRRPRAIAVLLACAAAFLGAMSVARAGDDGAEPATSATAPVPAGQAGAPPEIPRLERGASLPALRAQPRRTPAPAAVAPAPVAPPPSARAPGPPATPAPPPEPPPTQPQPAPKRDTGGQRFYDEG